MRDTSYMLFFYDRKIYVRTEVKITGQWKSMPFLISDIFSHEYPRTGSYAPKTPKGAGCIRKGGEIHEKRKKTVSISTFYEIKSVSMCFCG